MYALKVWGTDGGTPFSGWLTENWMGTTHDLSKASKGTYGSFDRAVNHSFIPFVDGNVKWEKVDLESDEMVDYRAVVQALLNRTGTDNLPAMLGVHPDLDRLIANKLGV